MPTKQQFIATKLFGQRDKINDLGIRVVLIPFFGIAIPLITRMIPPGELTNWEIKFSYLYTIGIAFIIYEGSRFLHFTLRSYFDWLDKPVRKILALILTIPFYCVPISVLLLVGWYHLFMDGVVDWRVVRLSVIIILTAVFFIVNLYETVFLVRDVANDKVKKEQLERARAEAELEALKSQIDPHFIFNSLNTLSHLIESKPRKAQQFNDNLAEVYRYILHNKGRDLVLLSEELAFLNDYFSLLKIRFEDAIRLNIQIEDALPLTTLLPPLSLQILIENAVKHNEFSDEHPLTITIRSVNEMIIVHNQLRKKAVWKPSSRIGLKNLQERYRLRAGMEIIINEDTESFEVQLPLLNLN